MSSRPPLSPINSPTDLEEFARTFKDEEELRRAVSQLLTKMGRSGVRITHGGSAEKGKDIVFYDRGGMGETRLFACVVKNQPISGSVDGSRGAKNVLFQIEQAFDEPLTGDNGRELWVDTVYVVSPYECGQATMDSVRSYLKRRGQADFICGRRLMELFVNHWPQFLCFESNVLTSYLVGLNTDLEQDASLLYLLLQYNLDPQGRKRFSDVYVNQHLHQELNELNLRELDLPDRSLLFKSLRLNELVEIMRSFRPFVEIARAMNWEWAVAPGMTLEQQHDKITQACSELWNRTYAEHERRRSSDSGRKSLKQDVSLQLPMNDELRAQYEHLCEAARSVRGALSSLREGANKIYELSSHDEPLVLLGKANYLDYCTVCDVLEHTTGSRVSGRLRRRIEFPDDTIHLFDGNVMITAPAGYGKTSYCRWHVLQDARQMVDGSNDVVPVYLPLGSLATGSLGTFEEVFFRSVDLHTLLRLDPSRANTRRFRLYLDGLDEVPTKGRRASILALLLDGLNRYPNMRVVLTARDHVCGSSLAWLPRVQLSPLDDTQQLALVEKWLPEHAARAEFLSQLETVPPIQTAMSVPLLATLTLAVYTHTLRLPSSKCRLYAMFTELLCGGWDLVKNVRRESRFGSDVKQTVLIRLAGLLHEGHLREFGDVQFRLAIQATLKALAGRWRTLLDEVVQDGLVIRTGDALLFAHLSFQEYLASRDIDDPGGTRQVKALRRFLKGEDWWREVLSFYVAGMENPQSAETWVAQNARGEGPMGERRARIEYLQSALSASHPHFVARSITKTGRLVLLGESELGIDTDA